MTYPFEFSPQFERSMKKLKRKDKITFEQVRKKLLDLIEKPEHFKSLKNALAGYKRMYCGSLVLIYAVEDDVVRIISYHHDRAY